MSKQHVLGWTVEWDAPNLLIYDHLGRVAFATNDWNPNMADPRTDALSWASSIADPSSGLTVDYDDDPAFGASVRYVRAHAPDGFADECAALAELDG